MRTCKLSFIARGRLIEVRREHCRNELAGTHQLQISPIRIVLVKPSNQPVY
jgi:hypothetical protein